MDPRRYGSGGVADCGGLVVDSGPSIAVPGSAECRLDRVVDDSHSQLKVTYRTGQFGGCGDVADCFS
jgi:hypothetical protein